MKAPSEKSTANQRKEHIVEKFVQWVTRCLWQYGSIFIRLAVVASQICEILWKFRLLAVQGHRSWCQSKAAYATSYWPLIVTLNVGLSPTVFWDIDALSSKITCFPIPPLFDAPSGRKQRNLCPIERWKVHWATSPWQYDMTIIHLAVDLLAPKSAKSGEIPSAFELIPR